MLTNPCSLFPGIYTVLPFSTFVACQIGISPMPQVSNENPLAHYGICKGVQFLKDIWPKVSFCVTMIGLNNIVFYKSSVGPSEHTWTALDIMC